MSKKDQAFKLFAEGKKPSSPEVKSLGLASKTRYNYFQEWKKPGAPVKTKAQEIEQSQVSISSLPVTDDIDKAQFIKFNRMFLTVVTPVSCISLDSLLLKNGAGQRTYLLRTS